ncbi:MAG: hypothetical protein NBV77_07105 [Bacteroidia bacterium]|nr:hypothetical protein [Bacteroidia bacterium]
MRKNLVKLSAFAFALVAFGTSCTEEEKPADPSIVGTWDINKILFTMSDSATNTLLFGDTTMYAAGEYTINFQANNMVISTEKDGSVVYADTSYYSVSGKTLKIAETADMMDAGVMNIDVLTTTDVKLTFSEYDEGTKWYQEITGKRK